MTETFLLTQDANSQFGRIFYLTPANMSNFNATFDIYLGSIDGADGMAFHFCPVYDYLPEAGGSLDANCPGGYFVAFDTYEDLLVLSELLTRSLADVPLLESFWAGELVEITSSNTCASTSVTT